jgi:hypothetical protein
MENRMDTKSEKTTGRDRKVSRRWVLRSTVSATAAVAAIGAVHVSEAKLAETVSTPDHDPATGEIFDRDRHHHWDTV